MDEALAMHDACLRAALHQHCGYEVGPPLTHINSEILGFDLRVCIWGVMTCILIPDARVISKLSLRPTITLLLLLLLCNISAPIFSLMGSFRVQSNPLFTSTLFSQDTLCLHRLYQCM